MIDTDEQRAITDFVRRPTGNLIIDALAGAAKTTTIIKALQVIPQRSILICAFNKRIATEMAAKLPKMPRTHVVIVKTFHALGLAILTKHFPHLQVDGDASEDLINRAAGQAINFNARRAAVKVLRLAKETLPATTLPPDVDELLALGYEHDAFPPKMGSQSIGLAIEAARDAYQLGQDFANIEKIDFCDMVWGPLVKNLAPPSRYQALFVDELQDISEPQFALLRKLMLPTSRFIAAGDIFQSIYSWRGADARRTFAICIDELKAATLPLTMTFRCPISVVNEARGIVPALRHTEDAIEGTVSTIPLSRLPSMLNVAGPSETLHTFVLSRTNKDLLDCALGLWKERVRFTLNAGKEMLDPLFTLLKALDLTDTRRFMSSLSVWRATELARAEKTNATSFADRVEERYAMLARAANYAPPHKIGDLLSEILHSNSSGVLLSTVHKVKGLEADRVFLLKQTFARHKPPKLMPSMVFGAEDILVKFDPTQEDLNIEYVAITRAKEHLIWVNIERPGAPVLADLMPHELQQLADDLEREMLRFATLPDGQARADEFMMRLIEVQELMARST